jgi:DNA replication protein DnaC
MSLNGLDVGLPAGSPQPDLDGHQWVGQDNDRAKYLSSGGVGRSLRSVPLRSAAALLEQLHLQTPEDRQRKLRSYANVGLLCVDEVGYLSFDDKSADLLYEVVNRRYERKSVILTTNKPFKEWNEVFPSAAAS